VAKTPSGELGEYALGAAYGEELATLIAPSAPELAKQVRSESWSRTDFLALIAILIQMLALALGEIPHDPPPPSGQTVFIIEQDETTIINLPPQPPAPPTPAGPSG
jgi:hypothetical protein